MTGHLGALQWLFARLKSITAARQTDRAFIESLWGSGLVQAVMSHFKEPDQRRSVDSAVPLNPLNSGDLLGLVNNGLIGKTRDWPELLHLRVEAAEQMVPAIVYILNIELPAPLTVSKLQQSLAMLLHNVCLTCAARQALVRACKSQNVWPELRQWLVHMWLSGNATANARQAVIDSIMQLVDLNEMGAGAAEQFALMPAPGGKCVAEGLLDFIEHQATEPEIAGLQFIHGEFCGEPAVWKLMGRSDVARRAVQVALKKATGAGEWAAEMIHLALGAAQADGDDGDRAFASALDAGLIDLAWIGAQNRSIQAQQAARQVFSVTSTRALQSRSQRILRAMRASIQDALDSFESKHQADDWDIAGACRSMIARIGHQTKTAMCSWCKSAVDGKVKRCAKCGTPYCSKDCQVADWKQGDHKHECKLKRSDGVDGQSRSKTKARSKAGDDVIFDRMPMVIIQAHLAGLRLGTCVICATIYAGDIPQVGVVPIEKFLEFTDADELATEENRRHARLVLDRNRASGALTAAVFTDGKQILKTLPHQGGSVAGCRVTTWEESENQLLAQMLPMLTDMMQSLSESELGKVIAYIRQYGNFPPVEQDLESIRGFDHKRDPCGVWSL